MKFKIESESFLGMGHCGSVSAEGTGFVELDENEVSQLVDLIREKKTTDVEELGLQKLYPAVYEKLVQAYGDVDDVDFEVKIPEGVIEMARN